MLISNASLKMLRAMLDIEIEAFTKNKPTALYERQVALHRLHIQLVNFIKEKPDSAFTIKNTTAIGDYDLCITVKNCVSPTRIYEIRISNDCRSFTDDVRYI